MSLKPNDCSEFNPHKTNYGCGNARSTPTNEECLRAALNQIVDMGHKPIAIKVHSNVYHILPEKVIDGVPVIYSEYPEMKTEEDFIIVVNK